MVGRVLAKDELGVRFSLPAQEDRVFHPVAKTVIKADL